MDTERQIISRQRRLVEASLGLEHVIRNIETVIREVSKGKRFEAIGMGTPGTYMENEDRLYGSPHTPIYEIPGFIQKIRNRFTVPLIIENDANCLALAEFFTTCVGVYSHVLAVIIGTGMGYGLILDNKLYRGARGAAGEIGHTTIDYKGRICECGRKGCAEAYLSGPSISRRFFEMTGENMEVPDIFNLYLKGNKPAKELFEETLKIMGEVFANAINTFDLEAIILGGGVSNLPIWYKELSPFINKSLFGIPRREIPIIPAKLGDSAGVLGAAYLSLRHLNKMSF
jgi:predicted NBD/HSP70 family sugar kinase